MAGVATVVPGVVHFALAWFIKTLAQPWPDLPCPGLRLGLSGLESDSP